MSLTDRIASLSTRIAEEILAQAELRPALVQSDYSVQLRRNSGWVNHLGQSVAGSVLPEPDDDTVGFLIPEDRRVTFTRVTAKCSNNKPDDVEVVFATWRAVWPPFGSSDALVEATPVFALFSGDVTSHVNRSRTIGFAAIPNSRYGAFFFRPVGRFGGRFDMRGQWSVNIQ